MGRLQEWIYLVRAICPVSVRLVRSVHRLRSCRRFQPVSRSTRPPWTRQNSTHCLVFLAILCSRFNHSSTIYASSGIDQILQPRLLLFLKFLEGIRSVMSCLLDWTSATNNFANSRKNERKRRRSSPDIIQARSCHRPTASPCRAFPRARRASTD